MVVTPSQRWTSKTGGNKIEEIIQHHQASCAIRVSK
jgi:hypothetical protein